MNNVAIVEDFEMAVDADVPVTANGANGNSTSAEQAIINGKPKQTNGVVQVSARAQAKRRALAAWVR